MPPLATDTTRRGTLTIAASLLLAACGGEQGADATRVAQPAAVDSSPGAWLRHRDRIDAADTCGRMVLAQLRALDSLRASPPDFDAWRVPVETTRPLAQLDDRSLRSARAFRTRLREQLATTGVNFAGRHSVVAVGMTGWGMNRWIVDRVTGVPRELPWLATYVAHRPDSRLLVLDPADSIVGAMERMADWREGCALMGGDRRHAALRPHQFVLEADGRLRPLTPADSAAPANAFWRDFLRGAR